MRALGLKQRVLAGLRLWGGPSGTATAAEPLGVDCRNLQKRKIPSSCFLAFLIMLVLIRRSCSKR